MRVLVTGGNGFIGSHVIDKLQEKGHEVISYDLLDPYKKGLNHIRADILDLKGLNDSMNDIDVVYHLAAVSDVNVAYKDPVGCVNVNNLGTLNVLDAARKNDINRVIFASTIWVYSYSKEEGVSEETGFCVGNGGHIYTSTKLAGELACVNYKEMYGQDFTILRYGIPYGPRARDNLVIPIFVRKALCKEPLTLFGDGNQHRNFIYVEDLADGNVLALKEKAKNQIYNLCGKKTTTIKEIALTIKKLLGDVDIKFEESRGGDYRGKNVSSEKANAELCWEPKTSFLDGMNKYIDWYKLKKGL